MLTSITRYTQNGMVIATLPTYNYDTHEMEQKPIVLQSQRFHPVMEYTGSQTISEWLVEHYSASQALLREMAKGMALAEIGGYWFFADGSELAISPTNGS